MSVRWGIDASIAGGFGGGFGAGYIHASGGRGGFLRPQPYYGWGTREYGWRGPSHAGLSVNVAISDIGAFFRNLFHSGPDVAANEPVFYRPDQNPPQVLDPPASRLSGPGWQPYAHHTSEPELPPGVVPVTMRYMPAGRPPEWKTTQQQITGVDLIKQPERKVAIPPHMSGVLGANTDDLTAPRPEGRRWQGPANEQYLGRPDLHIGNS